MIPIEASKIWSLIQINRDRKTRFVLNKVTAEKLTDNGYVLGDCRLVKMYSLQRMSILDAYCYLSRAFNDFFYVGVRGSDSRVYLDSVQGRKYFWNGSGNEYWKELYFLLGWRVTKEVSMDDIYDVCVMGSEAFGGCIKLFFDYEIACDLNNRGYILADGENIKDAFLRCMDECRPHILHIKKNRITIGLYSDRVSNICKYRFNLNLDSAYRGGKIIDTGEAPIKEYNMKCPLCGSDAFDLVFSIDCSNIGCKNGGLK